MTERGKMGEVVNSDISKLNDQIALAESDDELASLLTKRAMLYKKSGRIKEAASDYLDIIETIASGDKKIHAKGMLSLLFLEQGDKEKALWWAAQAMDMDSRSVEANMAMGLALAHGEMFHLAKQNFESIVELEKGNLFALLELGRCYRETLEFEKSLAVFHKLIAIDPDNAEVHFELGWTWELQAWHPNCVQKAIQSYEKAVSLNPQDRIYAKTVRKLSRLRDISH